MVRQALWSGDVNTVLCGFQAYSVDVGMGQTFL